jgi:hypothetical protein
MLFGADAAVPPDATKHDGTTETTLDRSLSALPPDERGWITFAETRGGDRTGPRIRRHLRHVGLDVLCGKGVERHPS